MRTKVKNLTSLFIILLLQISVLNHFDKLFKINLMLIAVIYYSERIGNESIPMYSLLLGFIYDVLISPRLGIQALILYLVSLLIVNLRGYIFSDSYKIDVLYSVIGVSIYNIIFNILMFVTGKGISFSLKNYGLSIISTCILLVGIKYLERNKISSLRSWYER